MPEDDLTKVTPEPEGGKPPEPAGGKPAKIEDYGAWLKSQPAEVQEAHELHVHGLKSALEKERKAVSESAEEVATKARAQALKELEEEKLLEDGKKDELIEVYKKDIEKFKVGEKQRERLEKVDKLLDKHNVTDLDVRELFRSQTGELEQVDGRIASYQATIDALVEKAVQERLGTTTPPKSKVPEATLDLDAQIAKAEAEGDYKTSMALKDQKMEQIHAQARSAPAPTEPAAPAS